MTLLFLIAFQAACLWTLLARIGVHMASAGEDKMRPVALFFFALFGGSAAMLTAGGDPAVSAISLILCSGLVAGALVDRQTGWAPDLLVFPIVVLAMILGTLTGAWDISPLRAAIYATVGYWLLQGAWIVAVWKIPDFSPPPPGDLIALFIPMMFFGADYRFTATMFAMVLLLLLARRFSPVYRLFSRPDLVMRIANENSKDYPKEGQGITFLALAFPVTGASLIISGMV